MIIKKIKNNEQGSILILTMLALVGAISIAVAMSSISIVERKMTTKTRKSTTAFQSANSGIEWAMKKINDANGIAGTDKTIQEVFGGDPDINGQMNCPVNLFSVGSGLNCKVTFLKKDTTSGERVIITGGSDIEDIVAIRSAGTFGTSTEKVGRALEAYAMPNCGADERVADFCIDNADSSPSANDWGAAVADCESAGKRLCTAAELVAANEASVVIHNLFSADVTGDDEYAVVDGSAIDSVTSTITSAASNFRCCRNR
jgi:Tfp pilus assembly protein PilX